MPHPRSSQTRRWWSTALRSREDEDVFKRMRTIRRATRCLLRHLGLLSCSTLDSQSPLKFQLNRVDTRAR